MKDDFYERYLQLRDWFEWRKREKNKPEKLKIKTKGEVFIKNLTIQVNLEQLSKPLAEVVIKNPAILVKIEQIWNHCHKMQLIKILIKDLKIFSQDF